MLVRMLFTSLIRAQNIKASWLSISNFANRNINLCSNICPYDGFHYSAVWDEFLKKFQVYVCIS